MLIKFYFFIDVSFLWNGWYVDAEWYINISIIIGTSKIQNTQ